jgi:ribosomal protein S18 acetylase RimI-like enzyme
MDDDEVIRPAGEADVWAHVGDRNARRQLLDHLAHKRGVLLFAFRGEAFLGHIFVRLVPPEEPELHAGLPGVPLLQHLSVTDEHRRNGVGRRLIGAAEALLSARGHTTVALGVDPANTAAISLYRTLFFAVWREETLTTFREDVRDDGTTVREADQCLVFIKHLARPPP